MLYHTMPYHIIIYQITVGDRAVAPACRPRENMVGVNMVLA